MSDGLHDKKHKPTIHNCIGEPNHTIIGMEVCAWQSEKLQRKQQNQKLLEHT
jgi:hypothetical protein